MATEFDGVIVDYDSSNSMQNHVAMVAPHGIVSCFELLAS